MTKEELIIKDLYEVHDGKKIWSKYWKKYLSGTINKKGYNQVILKCVDGKYRKFLFHRVIWYFINGIIPQDMQVNHIDENKQNNALSNLNLMTPKENSNWGSRNERVAMKRIGMEFSEEHKRKMSKSHNGKKLSEETRAKISASLKGRIKKQATHDRVACGKIDFNN